MFQILKSPSFDFMGKRGICKWISFTLLAASVAALVLLGLERGIEFAGGTELQIKYAAAPDLGEIRSTLKGAGFGEPLVTTIGDPAEHEVHIRLSLASDPTQEQDPTLRVVEALRDEETAARMGAGLTNVNTADADNLAALLATVPDMAEADARSLAETVIERRNDVAIFESISDLASVPGMTPGAEEVLEKRAFAGPFAVRSQSYIGPAIGSELVQKAFLAIAGSLLGMLVYIWIRFQFQWGLAAVAALAHDTVITLGLFSFFGKEMSLPVVAAFLTLIGYSVNDTVVVFDRIRENLRLRASEPLETVINLSINQTLSRTVITSGLTWFTVFALFVFGGEALNPFAFVLTVGIAIGTYSSIYVASPILVFWHDYMERRGRSPKTKAKASGSGRSRKASTGSRSA